jgi:NAD-dependent SIR2 family protein deacetylase
MNEKTITCIQCGNTFVTTISQLERLIGLGLDEPKRCRDCRDKKSNGDQSRYEKKMKHKNGNLRRQRDFMYNIQKKRDALIVAGNGTKSSVKDPRPISMMEDDDHQ